MICDNCKNKIICKNYEYLLEHSELILSDCTLRVLRNPDYTDIRLRPPIIFPLNENNNKEIEPQNNDKDINEKEPMIKCPNCNCLTFSNDLEKCSECGKVTCSSCSYNIIDLNGSTTRICDECNNDDTDYSEINNNDNFKTVLLKSIERSDDE